MSQELEALNISVKVREVGETTWKTLVCEIDDQASTTNDVTETSTKCGTKVALGIAKTEYSGNASSNVDPTEEEASYNDVFNWQQNRTNLEFLMQNEAFTDDAGDPVAEGAVLHQFSIGWFINSVLTGGDKDVAKFSWTFKPKTNVTSDGTSA